MTSRFRGAVAVTAGENIETAMVAAISGCSSANRTTTSEAMEWPSAAIRPSPSPRDGRGDLRRLVDEQPRGALDLAEIAAQRPRIAAVAGKIEGRGDIAVARERQREGLHQPPGTREAMRDDDDGAGRAGRGPIDRRGRPGDVHRRDAHAGIFAVEFEERNGDRERREDREQAVEGEQSHARNPIA